MVKLVLALVSLLTLARVGVPGAAQAEKRIALVIGNAGYQAGALNTPANDAGLIAQTLQAAGFDVVGARDLDQDTLRHAFRDFVEKATGSGPDTGRRRNNSLGQFARKGSMSTPSAFRACRSSPHVFESN